VFARHVTSGEGTLLTRSGPMRLQLVLATLGALLVTLGVDARQPRQGRGNTAASTERPRIVLPTIKTVVHPSGIYVAAIKRDGTAWERTLKGKPLVFDEAREIPQVRGARACGTDLGVRADGSLITRQPFASGPNEGWTPVPAAAQSAIAAEARIRDQAAVRLVFPDSYLFAGGTLLQKYAPLGTRLEQGRLAGAFVAENIAQFELGGSALVTLHGDGGLVSTPRKSGTPTCVGRSVASMAFGERHGVAVLADGRVSMWGDLRLGQLGRAGSANAPLTPVRGLANITQVDIWDLEVLAVALDRAGNVWTWGAVGPAEWVEPVRFRGLTDVVYVDYSVVGLALKSDGTAWAFNPVLADSVPVKVFDNVKLPERLALPSRVDSPCTNWSERERSPLMVPVPDGNSSTTSGDVPREPTDPPSGPPADPGIDTPQVRPRSASPDPFVIAGRYACEDASGASQGTVAVTSRSRLSCEDARREHQRLKATKGGDFCAAAVQGSHTVSVDFVQTGPCQP